MFTTGGGVGVSYIYSRGVQFGGEQRGGLKKRHG